MEKLQMCRICLVENVRMYLVVNKDLHHLYEKLTDNPFITEDSRPHLACYFCCTKLKQCFRFMRKCLEAEELFTHMMDEDYQPNSSINTHLDLCNGFSRSHVEHINIIDKHQTKIVSIKEELPPVCERLHDAIETYENRSIGLLPDNMCHIFLNVDDILPAHSESDSEDDVPSVAITTEVEEEIEVAEKEQEDVEINSAPVTRKRKLEEIKTAELKKNEDLYLTEARPTRNRRSKPDAVIKEPYSREQRSSTRSLAQHNGTTTRTELEPANVANTSLDVEDMPLEHSRSDSEVPILKITTEVSEKQRASETNEPADVANTSLDVEDIPLEHSRSDSDVPILKITVEVETLDEKNRRTQETNGTPASRENQLEDTTEAEIYKNEQKVSRNTRDRRSKPIAVFKEPYKREKRTLNGGKETKQIKMQNDEKPYKCDICQRSFSIKDHLIKHAMTHTGKKPFKCDVCKRSFSQKSHLTKHIRTHTGEKPFKCDICQRCFSVKGSLAQHNLTHTGEKPYKCDICQRTFRQKGSLTNHIRIHTGEKPYKCNVCSRSFSQKTPLRNHILIHTGEKPYKCDVCQHGFCDKATLVKHSRIHTGVKPYKCEICQNSFNQKINLRKHIRTHTGEKPYKCDVCQRNFSQKVHLMKHMRVHA